jgi:hypothetical protein
LVNGLVYNGSNFIGLMKSRDSDPQNFDYIDEATNGSSDSAELEVGGFLFFED